MVWKPGVWLIKITGTSPMMTMRNSLTSNFFPVTSLEILIVDLLLHVLRKIERFRRIRSVSRTSPIVGTSNSRISRLPSPLPERSC